jgi:hypothetical protein
MHHKVEDFNRWKPYFDKDENRRLSFGIKLFKLFRNDADENDVHFIFEIERKEKFLACISAPDLQNLMQEAGVLEKPEFIFLNEFI